MHSKISKFITPIVFLLVLVSCRKKPLPFEPPINPPVQEKTSGTVLLKLNNMVGDRRLELNRSTLYSLNADNQYSVSVYKYYLSNFVLSDDSGHRFVDSNSYYLVDQSVASSLQIALKKVPFGRYTKIEFLIGVDSLRNVSGAQDGFLSPSYGMFWTWSTGYIMAKMEGRSPQSTNFDNTISYHIGGFKDPYNVLQKVSLSLPNDFRVRKDNEPHISLKSDLNAWFGSILFRGFALSSMILTEGAEAQNMAMSYATMFSIIDTHY